MLNVYILTFHTAVLKIHHVGQTNPWFNFIANSWLFEDFTYQMTTLEMVCLIPVLLSLDPPVLQLPQALCEIGDEQREYELSL